MIKKFFYGILLLFFILQINGWAASSPVLTVSGAVKKAVPLSLDELSKMQSISVRLNEVDQGKNYKGAFNYQAIPLRTLLEQAGIQKENSDFSKQIDLAVVVRNKAGKQIALSWGELFYRNPSEVTVAFSAAPIMPHKNCESCHKPEIYENWFGQLKRPIGLPKLIVANDFYTDRSLEEITDIQVIDLKPVIKTQKMTKLHSPSFEVSGTVKKSLTLTDLSSYSHKEIMTKSIGEGMGFHGLKSVEGVPLVDILERAGAEMDLSTVILISAPDGYRSLVSFGELFLAPAGRRILIADIINHNSLDKDGKFFFIPPDDLAADRDVKAVEKIEVINLFKK
jgi:hypothetical protein